MIGDFNAEDSEPCLSQFLTENEAKNIVKNKTCFKSISNPSCIDLFITNHPNHFQNTLSIPTGLSDFHNLVVTVLKSTFQKAKPKELLYRDYKNFSQETFKSELNIELEKNGVSTYEVFEKIFLNILNKHAPIKKKYVRANDAPYMTKILRKAIMRRSQLEKKYQDNRNDENKLLYKKQRNFCSKLYKKERKKYFTSLDPRLINDNKKFWNTICPFLSDKGSSRSPITLINKGKIVSDDCQVATENYSGAIETAIKKFSCHPSILAIDKNFNVTEKFNFVKINPLNIENEILKLNSNKAGIDKDIPCKILKETIEISSLYLSNIWNEQIIDNKDFSTNLKKANICPVFKQNDRTLPKNYRPISLLPNVSKIFERILQTQLLSYMEKFLSPALCGYRKGFNTQMALIRMIEKMKESLDKKGLAAAVLMDLSKAFDTINHELLIAKLHSYGFDKSALEIIWSYLNNRLQRTKINASFSSWTEILQGVPQGSILGPILFNLYINDLFLILKECDVCNYADDTTPYACDRDIKNLFNKLEHDSALTIEWFQYNYMKLNAEKCHLLVPGYKHEHTWVKLENKMIWEDYSVKLLGVHIDSKLNFENHIQVICAKAGRKLSALRRIVPFLTFNKKRTLLKSFFESQFSYCPLVWMFHSRKANNKINRLHERALRLIYNDYNSSFDQLLEKDGSVSIHHRNIHSLSVQMYKIYHGSDKSNPLHDMISVRSDRTLRSDFPIPAVRSENNGKNSVRYLGPLIWKIIPPLIKQADNLYDFKKGIKRWKPTECPCRLCKMYIQNLGFINTTGIL